MTTKKIVQFLHPGGEHKPDRLRLKDWNYGKHKRKFMTATGSWTRNANLQPLEGRLTFWGEWEPQSDVEPLDQKSQAGQPRWIHAPRLSLEPIDDLRKQGCSPCAPRGPQNTDPLVFGDRFLYALCQQFEKRNNVLNATQMARLNEGDIILFGSCVNKRFELDTVFVVGIHAPVRPNGRLPNWESDLHRKITMDLIDIPPCGLRLYGGATWSSDAPFSFVPCCPIEGTPRGFRRPVIEPSGPLSGAITPSKKQGRKITLNNAPAIWHAVVRQVLDQGCVLGTAVDEPPDASSLTR